MDEHSVFDSLVNRLSRSERKELFERLNTASKSFISQEPLKIIEEEDQKFDFVNAYRQLQWWERIWIFFKVVFQKANRETILEEMILNKLGKKIERKYTDVYWHHTGILGQNFYWNVKKLQEKIDFLRDPLRKALGSKKKDFFAFLAGWDMSDIQDQLIGEIQPDHVAFEESIEDPYKLRKEIEYRMEDIISGIDSSRKKLIYARVRMLHHLALLGNFQFDKMLVNFEKRPTQKMEAPLSDVRTSLVDLTNILHTMKAPPPEELMKLVFLFYLQDIMEDEESEDFDKRLAVLVRRTEECMAFIRYFNNQVPLLDLTRLVMRNIEYLPPPIPGGEDWFALYKQFWYERFDNAMKKYSEDFKRSKMIEKAKEYLKASGFPEVIMYSNIGKKYKREPQYVKTIGFIRGFFDRIFIPEMNGPLKLVLIDGEFYKDQNREEYNDAYNSLLWVNDRISSLEKQLASDGEYGLRIDLIEQETPVEKKRAERIQYLIDEIDVQMKEVISKTIDNTTLLKNVIGGILYGDMGGRYDTLSNMGYIGRNENKNLTQKLTGIHKKVDAFLEILAELYDSEKQAEK